MRPGKTQAAREIRVTLRSPAPRLGFDVLDVESQVYRVYCAAGIARLHVPSANSGEACDALQCR